MRALALSALPVVGLLYALAPSGLLPFDARPGAAVGQILGVVAAVLVLLTLLYLPAKRSDVLDTPNRRLVRLHITVGVLGLAVALAHSRLVVNHPPILVLLAFLGLFATGAYGRVVASRRLGPTFGRGGAPFRPVTGPPRVLGEFIERKRALLGRLAPRAREGAFALVLGDWVRHPLLAPRYYALTLEERRSMRGLEASGYQARVGALERTWRVFHLLLAWAIVIGLVAHVVTTLFFAEFAAGGREIYWWHLRK